MGPANAFRKYRKYDIRSSVTKASQAPQTVQSRPARNLRQGKDEDTPEQERVDAIALCIAAVMEYTKRVEHGVKSPYIDFKEDLDYKAGYIKNTETFKLMLEKGPGEFLKDKTDALSVENSFAELKKQARQKKVQEEYKRTADRGGAGVARQCIEDIQRTLKGFDL